jgi:hypothetical protein
VAANYIWIDWFSYPAPGHEFGAGLLKQLRRIMGNIFAEISSILKAPFTQPLDLMSLFLIVGLVIISAILWIMVLHYVELAASAVTDI